MYNLTIFFFIGVHVKVNASNEINTSNTSTNIKSTTPYNTSPSIFNSLIAKSIDKKETDSSTQSLKAKSVDNIDDIKEDITMTSLDTTNTHDELALMISLKNMQAS